jgi:hypothetical protein
MPPQNPATRLREVERGLGALARELEEITGIRPANLLWWRHELQDVIVALERRPLDMPEPGSPLPWPDPQS